MDRFYTLLIFVLIAIAGVTLRGLIYGRSRKETIIGIVISLVLGFLVFIYYWFVQGQKLQ